MDFVRGIQASATAVADNPGMKLRKAAQDFESVLLGSLLEQMEQTVQGESSDSGSGEMKSLGVEQLAKVWARRGGIGIAELVTPYLQKQATAADSKAELKVAAKLPMIVESGLNPATAK